MEPRPSNPDYQLVWPRALFTNEAAALLNDRTRRDWNDRCALLFADAFAGGHNGGPAADLRQISRDEAARTSSWTTTPVVPRTTTLTGEQAFLRDLLAVADRLHEDPSPRAYWKERKAGSRLQADSRRLSTQSLAREYVRLINELDTDLSYLDKQFGFDCVDEPRDGTATELMERWLHEQDLWPLSTERLGADEDLLFSVIELLHDHVARPRSPGSYHPYGECGWHRSEFDVPTGQQVYRWRVNKLLARSDCGLRLSDDGEDRGRLIAVTDEGRTDLVAAVTERTGTSADDQVRHALAQFRRRDASRHDKRSAAVTLALVLEERRHGVLEDALPGKDAGALFQIANQFAIRHQRADQKSDYDDFYLDWVFWLYLATVELTNRILDQQQALPSTAGAEE